MKKIRFIVNPISGAGKQKVIEKLTNDYLDKGQFDHEIIYTQAPKHATELSSEAAAKGYDVVVAVGGDGSVNEVGRGLIGSTTAMAVIPTGSGNGLARHLGIPLDLKKALEVINQSTIKKIDTATMNGIPFVGTAGVGFDAHVGWKFSKFGKRGFLSYIKLVLREYPKYGLKQFEIEIDGKSYKKQALLVALANIAQYGNNAAIAPEAQVDDGYLDVCIIKRFPLISVPGLVYKLFNRKFHRSRYVEIIRGKKIILKQDSKLVHVDGEPLGLGRNLEIIVNPLSLNVLVPKTQ